MWQKLSFRQYRGVWAAAAAVLAIAFVLAFPPMRALAVDFLGLFRVRRVTLVEFNPTKLALSGDSIHLIRVLTDHAVVTEQGDAQVVATTAEAAQEAGIDLRLPSALENQKFIQVQPGAHIEVNVDLEHVQMLMEEMERDDIVLPDALDGATIEVDIPRAVIAAYGSCIHPDSTEEYSTHDQNGAPIHGRDCTMLLQMASPTISAPPGLDVNQLGESLLQLMGMSADEAATFSRNVDWATTLVVPIPQNEVTHAELEVDGVPASLVQQAGGPNRPNYVLIWVKDDILYTLVGPGHRDDALKIANSLQ